MLGMLLVVSQVSGSFVHMYFLKYLKAKQWFMLMKCMVVSANLNSHSSCLKSVSFVLLLGLFMIKLARKTYTYLNMSKHPTIDSDKSNTIKT